MNKSNSFKILYKRGNPVLKYIYNVPWEHGETLADYELGRTTCALFLSLRYHKLHPNYIYERFQKLGKSYYLRILLVLVDVVSWKSNFKSFKINLITERSWKVT